MNPLPPQQPAGNSPPEKKVGQVPIPAPVVLNPHAGFDPHAGTTWLYPVDYITPHYLPLITEKTLYHNSLVILPNRFEKSFVSAVAMYNIYRWYPLGKVIFVASKRQAVLDQRDACERLMKFMPVDVAEMSAMKPPERLRMWMAKRVIFTTFINLAHDVTHIEQMMHLLDKVKLLIIDEPQMDHRNNTKTIQRLLEFTHQFRVLLVSTTCGRTVDASQLKSYLVTNIELQWGSPQDVPEDWLQCKKDINSMVTPLGPDLSGFLAELQDITQHYLQNLQVSKQICNTPFDSLTIDIVKHERARYEQSILTGVLRKNHHEIMLNFQMVEKLLTAYRILQRYGPFSTLEYFHRKYDVFVQSNQRLMALLLKIRQEGGPHPKFQTLENFLREFFQRSADARILVVVESHELAVTMNQTLQAIPASKHRYLFDLSYTGDLELFRTGQINVLIVLAEVEPALDIGRTDLVVLFNMTDKPMEFLAHIARTRGSHPGAIVAMATEGPEQAEIADILSNRRMFYYENRNILPVGVDLSNMMMRGSPTLIPPGFQPKGRQIMFNVVAPPAAPTTQVVADDNAAQKIKLEDDIGASSSSFSLPLQVGDKRKVVEVLADEPPAYDVANGHTYYQVQPVKQQCHQQGFHANGAGIGGVGH